jgi:acyl dehydratase
VEDPLASSRPLRYFEDFIPGLAIELGSISVSADEIVTFARQFDPQPFHVDEVAARGTIYGGLIASGLHTLGLFLRLLVPNVLNNAVSLGSPGMEAVRWPHPVRPGDTLTGRWTVLEARISRSKPDRGILRGRGELRNQHGETVLEVEAINFMGRRPPHGGGAEGV